MISSVAQDRRYIIPTSDPEQGTLFVTLLKRISATKKCLSLDLNAIQIPLWNPRVELEVSLRALNLFTEASGRV